MNSVNPLPEWMEVIHRNNNGKVGLQATAKQIGIGVRTLKHILNDAGVEWVPFDQSLVRKCVDPTRGHIWSDTEDTWLRALWMQDSPQLSSAEIGRQMRLSKNAVIGRARRLGLLARPSPIVRSDRPKPARVKPWQDYRLPALPSLAAPKPVPRPRVVAPVVVAPEPPAPRPAPIITPTIGLFQRPQLCGEPDDIAEVRAMWAEQERRFQAVTRPVRRRCEWIAGDVGHGRTPEFCGAATERGSFCEEHHSLCFTTRESRVFQPFRRVG